MNLNKFTKAELISKFKTLETKAKTNGNKFSQNNESNQTLSKLIVTTLINFKAILIKITLITFIIKWIRNYSLVQKLWHIFNLIGSTLLGFSLIDIYSWDVISWIKDTSIFKWYAELFSKVSIETNSSPNVDSPNVDSRPVEFRKNMNENSIGETNEIQKTNSTNSGQINRNIQDKIINQEVSTIEELNKLNTQYETNYTNYLIIAGVVITASVAWFYSDEIKTGAVSLIDWINSFRAGTSDSAGSGTNSNTTPTSTNIQKLDRIDSSPPSPHDIELIDKGKNKILTSPSLEDLNSQVKEKWSEGSNSPSGSSTSSTETITPNVFEQEAALKIANSMWRDIMPITIQDKIEFIETNAKNISDLKIKEQVLETFVELEKEKSAFVNKTITFKAERLIPELKIKQIEVAVGRLNKWIEDFSHYIPK